MVYAAETVLNVMPILYARNISHNLLFGKTKTPVEALRMTFSAKHLMCVCPIYVFIVVV